jgi:hypothetical protein
MPSAEDARREATNVRSGGSLRGNDGSVLSYTWAESIAGFEQAEVVDWQWRFADGTNGSGVGIVWRRGTSYFVLLAVQSVRTNRVAWLNETVELARIQESKAQRLGPFVPPAPPPPPPPASSTVGSETMPDMLLLLTARVGGAMAREGTVIRAFIDGKECGRAALVLGFTALSVASADTTAGCGAPGAAVIFRIGDDLANETLTWRLENFVTPVSLSSQSVTVGGGIVVRPVLEVNCKPVEAECTGHERLLWTGNYDAWIEELSSRGLEPSGDTLLRSWVRFRAERGEVFGNLAQAFLDEQPFTFILSVRYAPVSSDADLYVSIFNFGADRPVGGWTVRSGGASYTFPPDAILGTGSCRIYRGTPPESDDANTCPGAVLVGEEAEFGQHGFVEILDAEGREIDSVAW